MYKLSKFSLFSLSRSGLALALAASVALFAYAFAAPLAHADQDPAGCTGAGFAMFMDVFESDGTTPASSATQGATLKYQTTLDHAGGANCNISGGALTITTPDGVPHDVTPLGGIPVITEAGSAFVSAQVSYVVDSGDVVGSNVTGTSDWVGGTSHRASHQTLNGDSEISTPFIAPLVVEKTVETSFDRDWDWTIEKSADQTDLGLQANETFTVNYEVTVTPTSKDINHAVTGTITITNPVGNPSATVTSVVDELNVSGAATVVCPGDPGPYVIAAGDDLVCTYTQNSASPGDTENEATVTTSGDVPGGSDTEAVSYAGDPVNETDECVTVDDTNGPVGVLICEDDADKTINYSLDFGPQGDVVTACGSDDHDNIARFLTSDFEDEQDDTGQDNWTVHWTVNCQTSCTLTQGYWKTHNESFKGGAPTDETWDLLGASSEETLFFDSNISWFNVFWTSPKGNAWYNLAHQYMAAKLNTLGGADDSAVSATIALVEAFFVNDAYDTPAEFAALGKKAPIRAQVIGWAGTLGSYNEGAIGPGHCDEQNPV